MSIQEEIMSLLNQEFESKGIGITLEEKYSLKNNCKFKVMKKDIDSLPLKEFEFNIYEISDKNRFEISTWIKEYLNLNP